MAHGSKRWITDWKGRRRRSSDRTYVDWLGSLHRWDAYGFCPQCKGLRKRLPSADITGYWWHHEKAVVVPHVWAEPYWVNGVQHVSWRTQKVVEHRLVRTRISVDEADQYPRAELQAIRPFFLQAREIACLRCREKRRLQQKRYHDGAPLEKRWPWNRPRKDDRQFIHRKSRARIRAALHKARFDPELDLPADDRRYFDTYW